MDIWLAVAFLLACGLLCAILEIRSQQRRIVMYRGRCDRIERIFKEDGGMTCCKCGKPYVPLNDPDYIPELNICRDCLWKMYYGKAFEQEEPVLIGDRYLKSQAEFKEALR